LTADFVSAALRKALAVGLRENVLVARKRTGATRTSAPLKVERLDDGKLDDLVDKVVAHEGSVEVVPRKAVTAK
jgi:hypothetical protein